jgi:hypothetical protein
MPLLAIAAFILGIIAAILKLVGKDGGAIQWMLIIGLILVAASVIWGYGWTRWGSRSGPAA